MKIIKFDPILMRDADRILETASFSAKEEILSLLELFSKNAFLAYSLGTPVGIICSDVYDGKKRANFSVYVCPKYRRRGIGTALVSAVVEQAKKTSINSLICDFPNDRELISFVSSIGFQKRYSSHFMTYFIESASYVSGFENYDNSMFLQFVNAEADAFYPLRHRIGIEPERIQATENVRSFLVKAADKYFVYRQNGEIIAGGGVYNGEITDIFVSEKARGCGLGRKMIQKCIYEAYRSGERMVSLWVITENTPAVNLYRSLGFQTEKTHDFYIKQIQ